MTIHWNKELAAGVEEKGYHTNEQKNNITEVELVGFGNWRNGKKRKSRFKDYYFTSGLCNLVDNPKVNQDWEYKRNTG